MAPRFTSGRLLTGRMYVIPDDCLRVAVPVLTHRLHLSHEARAAGITPYEMVESIITRFDLPRQRSRKGIRHETPSAGMVERSGHLVRFFGSLCLVRR